MEKAIRKMFRGRTFLQVHGCVENTIRERTWHGTMERGGDAFWRVIMPRRSEEDLCLTAPPPLPGHVSSTIAKPKASIYFPSFSFRIYKNIYTRTHRYSSPINASFFPPLSLFRVIRNVYLKVPRKRVETRSKRWYRAIKSVDGLISVVSIPGNLLFLL